MPADEAAAAGRGAPSLRRTLLAWLLLPLLVLVPVAAGVVFFLALEPALDSLDRALTDTAVALSRILRVEEGVPSLPLREQTADALVADAVDLVVFAVGDGQGGTLGGAAALLGLARPVAAGQWVFFDGPWQGHAMRMVTYGAPCGARVCPVLVAESLGKRNQASRHVMLAALFAGLLLAASLGALAWVATARSLQPLRLASQALAQRSLNALAPLPTDQLPREVAFLGTAINDLLVRLGMAAASQRSFLDDASHQLRTPLAVVLSESAQALETPHPEALHTRLLRLHAAAERGAHLAHQLLTLARAEGEGVASAAGAQGVDLARLIADAATDWVRPAMAVGQDLGFELGQAAVMGVPWQLQELVGNLLHNAERHAGPGAHVTVRTFTVNGVPTLEVEDDGPGMDAAEWPRAWDRFYRGSGAPGGGTGLGLAIVQHIARAHGGEAELLAREGGHGLRVRVVFLPLSPG